MPQLPQLLKPPLMALQHMLWWDHRQLLCLAFDTAPLQSAVQLEACPDLAKHQ